MGTQTKLNTSVHGTSDDVPIGWLEVMETTSFVKEHYSTAARLRPSQEDTPWHPSTGWVCTPPVVKSEEPCRDRLGRHCEVRLLK